MRTVGLIWAALAVVYALFWLWHTPRGGPLTTEEIATYEAQMSPSPGEEWADQEDLKAFLETDDGQPFYMLNLIEYRDQVSYPDNYPSGKSTVESANQAYGTAVIRLQLMRGSYPAFMFEPAGLLINSYDPALAGYDTVAIARYRSRRDLMDMLASDAFQEAQAHKWASLERTLILPVTSIATITPGTIVPALLALIGLFATALARWTSKSKRGQPTAS